MNLNDLTFIYYEIQTSKIKYNKKKIKIKHMCIYIKIYYLI